MATNKDNYLKLLEKLSEIHSDVSVVKNELLHMKEDVSRNTKDLETHIRNSNTNTQRLNMEIAEREKLNIQVCKVGYRVARLEIPSKVFKYIKNSILVAGSLAAAIYGILKLFNINLF